MNDKNRDGFTLFAFGIGLMIDTTEMFCRMLADKTMLYYVGKEGDKYKFHDVMNDKELLFTKDEVMDSL